jgi:creatinine amidohydrolase
MMGGMRFFAAACALLAATTAAAAAPDTVFLEDLTWTEVRDLIKAGATTVIVPTGGTEQNGPHMALGKHNARVRALSEKIARALGHTLVAPVIAYVPEGRISPPSGHMRYPGTLTVPDDAFAKVLESAARSLAAHGFRDIVFLGDHGASQGVQKAVAARLDKEWASRGSAPHPGGERARARVHAVEEYYRASDQEYRDLLRRRGARDDEIGRHAGLADTSLMLAVDPRLVRSDRLARGAGATGADGVDGDPSRASAELGRLGEDLIVARTVAAIKQAIAGR